jgi:hypothetical protein
VCCTASHLATYALCSVLHCRVLLTHACRLQQPHCHSLIRLSPSATHFSLFTLLTLVAFSGLRLPATPSATPLPLTLQPSHSRIAFSDSTFTLYFHHPRSQLPPAYPMTPRPLQCVALQAVYLATRVPFSVLHWRVFLAPSPSSSGTNNSLRLQRLHHFTPAVLAFGDSNPPATRFSVFPFSCRLQRLRRSLRLHDPQTSAAHLSPSATSPRDSAVHLSHS